MNTYFFILQVQKCRGFYVNLQAEIYFIKT